MHYNTDCDEDGITDQACLKDGRNLDVILSTKNCSGTIANVNYGMCPNVITGMIVCKPFFIFIVLYRSNFGTFAS